MILKALVGRNHNLYARTAYISTNIPYHLDNDWYKFQSIRHANQSSIEIF